MEMDIGVKEHERKRKHKKRRQIWSGLWKAALMPSEKLRTKSGGLRTLNVQLNMRSTTHREISKRKKKLIPS